MVFFKINTTLLEVIKMAKLNKQFVGCTRLCDRQIISLDDLKVCIQQIKGEIADLETELKNQERIKQEEKDKKQNKDDSINAELMRMINESIGKNAKLSDKELVKMEKRLDELGSCRTMTAEVLGNKSEMVFTQDHTCNANLKFNEDAFYGVKITDPTSGK